ncbi:sensor histidine kinase [Sphingomicrobium astaxanthinifaciens]|uniref:sensor histidine kinase n=1 Tax=Sphingomicrobium astaxanthinifaciens TaxID=1227949 RepID=UPI00389A15ED
MALSRIEADRYLAPRMEIDLGALVRKCVEENRPLAERRGCAIATEIEEGVPAILGDETQLLQLADNLLGNAIRYGCTEGCDTVSVAVRRSGRDRVRLAVSDKGPGIAPEHLPRLTERFYRVDAARSRNSGGTGLGLAIVKHIAERHRGTLNIASALGTGTTITVDLPIAR